MNRLIAFSAAFCMLLLSCISPAAAQISVPAHPLQVSASGSVPALLIKAPDVNRLLEEDEAETGKGVNPLRFAKDIDYHCDLLSCADTVHAPGTRVHRIVISADDAVSLSLVLYPFYLPEGCRLFIGTPRQPGRLGAFTSAVNRADSIFACAPLPGDSLLLQLEVAEECSTPPVLNLYKLIYGYRDVLKLDKGYGGSGSCNININCPEGQAWQNEKRAVAMILTQWNTRLCTGSLLNNARQDGRPFFLTAHHCLGTENTWIFMFNYESPLCSNQDGPTWMTIQGATLLASDQASDFALLEISATPPPSYNPYFAGWDAGGSPSQQSVCIHHPSGDIKKISFDQNPLSSSAWGSGTADSHWTVGQWETGTTEPGSSGSPLFDAQHRIVGQLHGGTASCYSITDDNYGKFSFSWNSFPEASRQLKFWLDPDNTGILQLNGASFSSFYYHRELEISEILPAEGELLCASHLQAEVSIKNRGHDTVTSFIIRSRLDGEAEKTLQWTGKLSPFDSLQLRLETLTLIEGSHVLEIVVSKPNGLPDENSLNDSLRIAFSSVHSAELVFTTDNAAGENAWDIRDAQGNLLAAGVVPVADTTYHIPLCLGFGCYHLNIYDQSGNGLRGSGGAADSGNYVLTYNGGWLVYGSSDFGFSATHRFCINRPESGAFSFTVFPNPVNQLLFIRGEFDPSTRPLIQLYDPAGRKVLEKIMGPYYLDITDVSALQAGIYILHIRSGQQIFTQRLLIAR
jgi:lysyl endopeptidase